MSSIILRKLFKNQQNLIAKKEFSKRSAPPKEYNGGVPGETLPFKIGGRRVTLLFLIYFGIATTAPWLIVRYLIWKRNGV